jgi:hypothetical protein
VPQRHVTAWQRRSIGSLNLALSWWMAGSTSSVTCAWPCLQMSRCSGHCRMDLGSANGQQHAGVDSLIAHAQMLMYCMWALSPRPKSRAYVEAVHDMFATWILLYERSGPRGRCNIQGRVACHVHPAQRGSPRLSITRRASCDVVGPGTTIVALQCTHVGRGRPSMLPQVWLLTCCPPAHEPPRLDVTAARIPKWGVRHVKSAGHPDSLRAA